MTGKLCLNEAVFCLNSIHLTQPKKNQHEKKKMNKRGRRNPTQQTNARCSATAFNGRSFGSRLKVLRLMLKLVCAPRRHVSRAEGGSPLN